MIYNQGNNGCYNQNNNGCGRRAGGSRISKCMIGFLVVVLAFAVGLILGAVFYETFLPVLASVIAFAAAVLVVIIALLIFWHRRCE